jgi:hypothetical protein
MTESEELSPEDELIALREEVANLRAYEDKLMTQRDAAIRRAEMAEKKLRTVRGLALEEAARIAKSTKADAAVSPCEAHYGEDGRHCASRRAEAIVKALRAAAASPLSFRAVTTQELATIRKALSAATTPLPEDRQLVVDACALLDALERQDPTVSN